MTKDLPAHTTAWDRLRRHTAARIGLARMGTAIATEAHLSFQAAHAQARDAVHNAFDSDLLRRGLVTRGVEASVLRSAAADRRDYLLRPDLGRRLIADSRAMLPAASAGYDLAVVIADGLSARAVERHALPVLDAVFEVLRKKAWKIAPVTIVHQGRVAVGDEIGAVLSASMVAVFIGERPGLSSPDSMGIYLTWAPVVGRKDSERNCISNIRPEGLTYPHAAAKFIYLVTEARVRQLTGIMLKDETQADGLLTHSR